MGDFQQSMERSVLKDIERDKDKLNKLVKVKNNIESLILEEQ